MAPVSSLFLISLLYTFSKIQETIWKSGKLEWRGQYFLFFPDVPDFLHSSPGNKGGAGVVNGWTWIRPFSSLAHLDIGYSLLVIGYSLDVFHLFSAASAELIGHRNKFHINMLQRAKTTAKQLNCSI